MVISLGKKIEFVMLQMEKEFPKLTVMNSLGE
jgi:hypothetical protein